MPRHAIPIVVLLGGLALTAVPVFAQPVYETSRRGGVVNVPGDDPMMEAAKAKGRATLPDFLARASAPRPGQSDFAVKVGFRGRSGPVEYFWVTPFTVRGDRFTGALSNTPVYATQLRAGQAVSFGRAEIVDWNYRENGVMHGNFTGCAILASASEADRSLFRARMGLDCDR